MAFSTARKAFWWSGGTPRHLMIWVHVGEVDVEGGARLWHPIDVRREGAGFQQGWRETGT